MAAKAMVVAATAMEVAVMAMEAVAMVTVVVATAAVDENILPQIVAWKSSRSRSTRLDWRRYPRNRWHPTDVHSSSDCPWPAGRLSHLKQLESMSGSSWCTTGASQKHH